MTTVHDGQVLAIPLRVEVTGRQPRPQGSMVSRRNHVVDSNPQHRIWRTHLAKVIEASAKSQGYLPQVVGVRVTIQFRFGRPRKAIQERMRIPFTGETPDIDKLSRSALDALQEARIIRNDCQVVILASSKIYVDNVDDVGLTMTVESVTEGDLTVWPAEQGWT